MKAKPLRRHNNKVAGAIKRIVEKRPISTLSAKIKTHKEKEMNATAEHEHKTAASKPNVGSGTGGAKAQSDAAEAPDARVVALVSSMVPPDEKDPEKQKKLSEQISKLLEQKPGSVPYAVGEWPPADDTEAAARFFAGDVIGAEARKKEAADQAKAAEDLRKAMQNENPHPAPNPPKAA